MEEKNFFNFRSGEEFNLDDEYKNMFGTNDFVISNPNEDKLKDAENIIGEYGGKYVEIFSLKQYEDAFININEFLSKFRTDSDDVKNMKKEGRDKLFGYGKELFKYYQDKYSGLNFNFEITREEWHYIDNILNRKLSYNGQELFNYWELYTKFLGPTNEMVKELPKQLESFIPKISIQNLILISHLLMTHEEKGGTKSFHNFRTILTETAQMTKLFNAYGVMLERSTNRFNNWVNSLNAMDGFNNDDRVDNSDVQE